MKKVIALMLAMVMVLGLCSMASATAPNEKVQINNMMVDASMVEAKTEEAVAVQAQPESVSVQTDLVPNEYFPPLQHIEIPGYEENISFALQNTTVLYTLDLPVGTTIDDVNSRGVLFTFGGTSASSQVTGNITVTYNEQEYSAATGGSVNVPMSLIMDDFVIFNISWNATIDGTTTTMTRRCGLQVRATLSTNDVSISSLTVAGQSATYESTSVGGVTRYNYDAKLPQGTAETVLDAATVVVTPTSSAATMILKNSDGTVVARDPSESETSSTYTFPNVNFNNGVKTLTVTCGTQTRDYTISADIAGRHITVYVAFRGYLADQWYYGASDYYDYSAYGSGDDLTGEAATRVPAAISAMLALKGKNAPSRIVGTNKRAVFEKASYIPVTLTVTDHSNENGRLPGMTVYDALIQAIADYNAGITVTVDGESVQLNPGKKYSIAQHGADNNYVDYMTFGVRNENYVENGDQPEYYTYNLGEFDCGSASGWMYTARTDIDDVTSALPNAGLRYWPISDGMYIDWYYTAAYGADFGYSMFDI